MLVRTVESPQQPIISVACAFSLLCSLLTAWREYCQLLPSCRHGQASVPTGTGPSIGRLDSCFCVSHSVRKHLVFCSMFALFDWVWCGTFPFLTFGEFLREFQSLPDFGRAKPIDLDFAFPDLRSHSLGRSSWHRVTSFLRLGAVERSPHYTRSLNAGPLTSHTSDSQLPTGSNLFVMPLASTECASYSAGVTATSRRISDAIFATCYSHL